MTATTRERNQQATGLTIGAGRPIRKPGLPCVAVPTTAGTGSEVTRNSVLSGSGVKASLRSPLMLPKIAIVDPDLLAGVWRNRKLNQPDLLHPNAEGARVIAERLAPVVAKVLAKRP